MNDEQFTTSWLRHAPALLIALVAAVCAGFLFALYIPITTSYVVPAEFDSMPPDDVSLLQWLASQPGVVGQSVHIERPPGTKVVKAHFRMTRPLLGEPSLPDVDQAWAHLGYTLAAQAYP
jgi:hypothetical protein